MIEKIVGILADKYLPTTADVKDSRAQEKVVHLLESLVTCHNLYRKYSQSRMDQYRDEWHRAVDDVVDRLDEIRLFLLAIDPEAFDAVHQYAWRETASTQADRAARDAYAALKDMEVLRSRTLHEEEFSIDKAIQLLRKIIAERIPPWTVIDAQNSYKARNR